MAHRSIPTTEVRTGPPPSSPWRSVPDLPRTPRSVVVAVVALIVAGGIGWWLLRPAAPPTETTLPLATGASSGAAPTEAAASASSGSAPISTTTVPPVVAQAAGAVREPGLYRLDPGARVDDLIRAAGGLTEQADRDRINLAAPVADGQRVWLPRRGQEEVPSVLTDGGGTATVPSTGGVPPGGATPPATGAPLDLNAADAEALDGLPGVGPATAQAILTFREESGPFRSVDDLLDVPGIGDAKLAQIRPHVTVG